MMARPRPPSRDLLRWLISVAAACVAAVGSLSTARADVVQPDGKVHVTYWEKWTGYENDAMQRVIDRFNASQDRIVVKYFATSQIDRKTIVATAGGDPPDIAGLWAPNVASFADAQALLPLDDFIRRDGDDPATWLDRYYPPYARVCRHAGRIYATISTPTTVALHWNRTLFREAGLDPDRPPSTLAELDEFAERLTRRDPATGQLTQVGFLPQEPGWWTWAFPLWFGGELFEDGEITLGTHPRNLAAFEWLAGYTRRLGAADLQRFVAGFGPTSSPESAFFSGKVAMVVQGVWYHNYISQFRPGLDYGVAGWPQVPGGPEGFTVAEADVLTIMRGARNPDAAWEFIKYIASANPDADAFDELEGAELLCFLQQKNSPLRVWSPFFTAHHPHPSIALFRELAAGPGAHTVPLMGIWQEYVREIGSAAERTRLLSATPAEAVAYAHQRIAASWARYRRSLERHHQHESLEPSPAP